MDENLVRNLPAKFLRNISELHGAAGEKWLANLPQTINEISRRQSLETINVFTNLSFNFVASAENKRGEKLVLKIGVPEEDSSMMFEARALRAFDGNGAVKLFDYDEELGAMLIEKADEGLTLDEICGEDYAKAVEIAVAVMSKLPRQMSNKDEFINLESWVGDLHRAVKAGFAPERISKARRFFGELGEPFGNKILLHGDIHFGNILSAQREPFLLIDPKGVIGEIGYEIAVFLNDLAGWTSHRNAQKSILKAAVGSFSRAFAVGETDLRKWAYASAVLSAWWTAEDFGDGDERHILRAEIWDV